MSRDAPRAGDCRQRDASTAGYGVVAAPSSFELDGQQYVAEEVGYGLARYGTSNQSRLLVFKLGATAALPTPPTMSATLSASNLVISWNGDAGTFTLISSGSLATPIGSWAPVIPQPTVLALPDGRLSMTIPLSGTNRFFDLKR